ncbi:MAG: hypothetical protein Q9162_004508 [Coniocarpon cinnabarinum]
MADFDESLSQELLDLAGEEEPEPQYAPSCSDTTLSPPVDWDKARCENCDQTAPLSWFVSFMPTTKIRVKTRMCLVCRGKIHSPRTTALHLVERFFRIFLHEYVYPQHGSHMMKLKNGLNVEVKITAADSETVTYALIDTIAMRFQRLNKEVDIFATKAALKKCLEAPHKLGSSPPSLESLKRELELEAQRISAYPPTTAQPAPSKETGVSEVVHTGSVAFAHLRSALSHSNQSQRLVKSATNLMGDFSQDIITLASASATVLVMSEQDSNCALANVSGLSVMESLNVLLEVLHTVEEESTVQKMVDTLGLLKYAEKAQEMARLLEQSAYLLRK